jgi:hypothetical protein
MRDQNHLLGYLNQIAIVLSPLHQDLQKAFIQ